MPDIKRLNYFNGQFLVDTDFKDEQAYHLTMRRRLNQALHAWGVARGLVVTRTADKEVLVSAGVAIDGEGREIVLLADERRALPASVTPNSDLYLTVAYRDLQDEADRYQSGGANDFKRTTERPDITFTATTPSGDGSVVLLARVRIDAAGNVSAVENGVRRLASSLVASGSDLEVGNLALTGSDPNSSTWARWSRGAANRADLAGTLSVSGNAGIGIATPENSEGWARVLDVFGGAHAKLSVRNSSIDARVMAHGSFWGAPAGMVIGTSTAHAVSLATGKISRVTVSPTGNVGIGTTGPLYKLHVAGTGGMGNEDANGVSLPGNTPIVGQADGTAFGLLNTNGRQSFALNIDANAGTNIARGVPSFYDKYDGAWHHALSLKNGRVGIGTYDPQAKLQVVGGAIMPAVGNSAAAGIQFPVNPGGGGGDEAFIRYFAESGESTKLLIGCQNDPDDRISFYQAGGERLTIYNGNVGIGTLVPQYALHLKTGWGIMGLDTVAVNQHSGLRLHENGAVKWHFWNDGSGSGNNLNVNSAAVLAMQFRQDGGILIPGRIGVFGQPPEPRTAGWGGGIHTFDIEVEGTGWSRGGWQTGNRDLAENYASDLPLEPGDVVCLDRANDKIVTSEQPNNTLVMGVVSTKPGVLLNSDCEKEERVFPVALCGRVPCKVVDENGPIERGDLLTTSSISGHAMKAKPINIEGREVYLPGTIIGKALESLESGTGTVEVWVSAP